MNQNPTPGQPNIGIRALYMILIGIAYHLSGYLLFVIAIVQLVFAIFSDTPNPRLVSFGRSLGLYVQQSANFLAFVTEEKPFPFSDWPS